MAVIVLVIVVAAALYIVYTRTNTDLVSKDNLCEKAWEDLDEQLERRSALIPKLIEGTVPQNDEQAEALSYLGRMQAAVTSATTPESKMSASAELTSVLNSMLPSLEMQPELKEELDDIDAKLTYARARYNECVYNYNRAIITLPESIVARGRFLARQSFDAVGDTARQQLTS